MHAFRVALWLWLGRVLMTTMHTAIPLAARLGFACSVLATCFLTIRTFLHPPILAHPLGHSSESMQLITVVWQQSTLLEFSYRFFDVGKIMEKYQQKKVRLFVYGMSMPALPNLAVRSITEF